MPEQPHIAVLGAGLGGTIAAYEIRETLGNSASITVVNLGDDYWFVPSNPWVAVGWREPDAIRVHLPEVMTKRGIGFNGAGARKVHPDKNQLELLTLRRLEPRAFSNHRQASLTSCARRTLWPSSHPSRHHGV